MTIVDTFDVHNPEHLEAFRALYKNGTWPLGFVGSTGADTLPETCWYERLTEKMTMAWIEHKLKEQE
jgi:hypothetical protein